MTRITEKQLILPALYLISLSETKGLTISDLEPQLRNLLKPSGEDLDILDNRADDKFSQKVRNLKSHNTLEQFTTYDDKNGIFTLTEKGEQYLQDNPDQLKDLSSIEENFEGEETLGFDKRENDEEVYPDAVVNISRESFSAFQLKRKHDQKPSALKLDPEFQREALWNQKQKSELIESILMGIPLPLIYVKEDDNGVFIIVDGRQRLTALFDFMNDKFFLKNLRMLQNINRKKFGGLTQKQQNKIEECQLALHVIKPPTKDRVTFDLFDRVNRGGTRLNSQEMRNAIYQGNATKLLKELSASENFQKATENSIDTKRMKDKYLILRFLAFYLLRKEKLIDVTTGEKVEYRSDMEDFLSKAMLFLNNDELSNKIIEKLPNIFESAMGNCSNLFGKGCFRLPQKENIKFRRPINMALFETISYFAAKLKDKNLIGVKDDLIKLTYKKLIKDEKYVFPLTHSVDSNNSITNRFAKIEEKIKEIQNA